MSSQDPPRSAGRWAAWPAVLLLLAVSAFALYTTLTVRSQALLWQMQHGPNTERPAELSKIHQEADSQYLWALGPKVFDRPESDWFDMTGAPLDMDKVNHGIGRDTIAAIDEPVFVGPDDPRLRRRWDRSTNGHIDDLPVIGFAHNGEARAYPIGLLNRHELVNDTVGGKPVTVGW